MTIHAVGTPAADQPLGPMQITRRDTGPHDRDPFAGWEE